MKSVALVKNQSGLTLVELLAVIVVIGIISSITMISLRGLKEKAEKDVCTANRVVLERQYRGHLSLENVEHSELIFASYLKENISEVCPVSGEIVYSDEHVDCSVHGKEVDEEDSGDEGGVPYF
jgi:prepilin-type N-terminal cleavage/methylation domain-containing protein